MSGPDMFTVSREPEEIIAEAMSHGPVAVYAAFSGGDTSLATAHWMMNHIPGCRLGDSCHADVLLELANYTPPSREGE